MLFLGFFVCAVGFVMLTKYEDRECMRSMDFAATVKVQEGIDTSSHLRLSAVVGTLMEGVGALAGPVVTSLLVLGITGYVVITGKSKIRFFALLIPVFFAGIVGIELVAKLFVHHPPPPFFMIKNPSAVFPMYHVSEDFSYPSGHAARAVFVVVLFMLIFVGRVKRRPARLLVAGLAVGYVVLVSAGKVYLGHHWLSDVIGGWLLGGAMGSLGAMTCVLTRIHVPTYNRKHNE